MNRESRIVGENSTIQYSVFTILHARFSAVHGSLGKALVNVSDNYNRSKVAQFLFG